MNVQLTKYQITTPSEPVANPQLLLHPSASDILGLGCLGVSCDHSAECTLAIEVKPYITDQHYHSEFLAGMNAKNFNLH